MGELAKWVNVDAGPRQVRDLARAAGALRAEGQTSDEVTGVVGGESRTSSYVAMCEAPRAEVAALDAAIRERFGCEVTRRNVREVIAAYEAALPEARESRPVADKRRSAEEDAELRAAAAAREAEYAARRAEGEALLAAALAKAPRGAGALIVAELHQDQSDPMTDYFSSRVVRTVAIGFRTGSREDFRQLPAAAGGFAETAHMASGEALAAWHDAAGDEWRLREPLEHRDNWSMGGGSYLSDHGSDRSGSGWVVRSRDLPCRWAGLTEDAIPGRAPGSAAAVPAGGVTVSPSSLGREGVVEIRFAVKPSEEVRGELKAHGFRWARGNGCWYGTDTAYAGSLAPGATAGRDAGSATAREPAAPAAPARSTQISGEVLAVLGSAVTDGSAARFTRRLDRGMYVQVNKVLEAAGGRWDRRAQAHLFPGDAGEVLAGLLAAGRVVTAQDEGYFPTPAHVAEQMTALAGLRAGMAVLEPSAGDGAIARAAADAGCVVDCAELNAGRAAGIRAAGYARTVTAGDFLAMPASPVYDAVLMNPPFAGKQDVAHVRHALRFVKPGGVVAAVMAAGVTFRDDRETAAFRALVADAGGEMTALPDGTFKAAGTGVRAVLVTIPVPAEAGPPA